MRPIALDTLMPVAIAGVPLEDQLVFAGGTLRQCRAQWEWAISERSFFNAHYEEARTKNLVSPLDGVLNTRTDITNLDRLCHHHHDLKTNHGLRLEPGVGRRRLLPPDHPDHPELTSHQQL